MAKRKTIKNNPLDSLSTDSTQESPVGLENLLMGTSKSSEDTPAKPSRTGTPPVSREKKRNPQAGHKKTSVVRDELPSKNMKGDSPGLGAQDTQKPTVKVSQDNLDHRITRLEDDSQLKNIMIGIILAPLALLALLGAAPPL